ncbi:MAG TPA: class A beta-lactamase-related serine hydrolase [Candidatus Hydrogenedentes bacterium]|nr:class A beta-lactamase-related serine hydrolase [Candidatus Hydrogenedentota bacterium]
MNAQRRACVSRCLLIAMSVCAAHADEARPLREAIDAAVQPLIEQRWSVAVAVGVITPAGRSVYGYGETRQHNDERPTGDTLFEIGSITKTFTGLVLAQLVEDGVMAYDTPIASYLPPGAKAPAYNGQPITIEHLVTHTSGLPRNPPDLFDWGHLRSLHSLFNPFQEYTPERLYGLLARIELDRAPGAKYAYSNLGAGLLGHILALKTGRSYEELVLERVCRPLGMKDTCIGPNADQRKRIAPGYIQILAPPYAAPPYPTSYEPPLLAGAGWLRSTPNDMLTYLAANIGLIETDWAQVIESTHRLRCKTSKTGGVGVFWQLNRREDLGGTVVSHTGSTGGYMSYAGFVERRRVGVIVLSSGYRSVAGAGRRILEALAGEATAEDDRDGMDKVRTAR